MPSMEEQLKLIKWVEDLPAREEIIGFENIMRACAERYDMPPAGLHTVINHHVEMYKRTLTKMMRKARADLDPHEMPDIEFIAQSQEKALAATLLRMWTYANEYYQRWTLQKVVPTESEFDAFLRDTLEGE